MFSESLTHFLSIAVIVILVLLVIAIGPAVFVEKFKIDASDDE